MLVYILKSTACLAILLLFYKIFLEKENMHTFKRFYLIGSLILSLIIPLLVFVEYVTVPLQQEINILNTFRSGEIVEVQNTNVPPLDLTSFILSIYYLGVAFFGFKFLKNLAQIVKRIRTNPKERLKHHTKVLLQEKMPPHTFFKFIFLNKLKFKNNEIPNEVLVHEEAHVTQKHSLDVIFIELLQVVLWFNPLVLLFKKAIKLNHEFLADQEVLAKNIDAITYQNTLLSFSNADKQFQPALLNAINYSSIKKRLTIMKTETSRKSVLIRSLLLLPLLSLLFYGFSSKRIIEKSEAAQFQIEGVWLIKETEEYAFTVIKNGNSYLFDNGYAVLPIRKVQGKYYLESGEFGTLFNLDTSTGILNLRRQNYILESRSFRKKFEGHWQTTNKDIELHIQNFSDSPIWTVSIDGTANKFYPKKTESGYQFTHGDTLWSFSIKDGILYDSEGRQYFRKQFAETSMYLSNLEQENSATNSEINEYKTLAKKYDDSQTGKTRMLLENLNRMQELYHKMTDEQRKNVSSYVRFLKPPQQSATRKQMAEYNKLAKHYNNIPKTQMRVSLKDVNLLTYIYNLMSEKQRKDAEPFPDFPEPPRQSATREQMTEYDKLAKHYNDMPKNNMRVYLKDVNRLTYIYNLMSEKQRNNAEPFPDFPEPPTPPRADNIMDVPPPPKKPKPSKNLSDVEYASVQIENIIEKQDPHDNIESPISVNSPPSPPPTKAPSAIGIKEVPPPPPPVAPIDHVIKMAKKGAVFYYEGKQISSEKAINIVKANKGLNIDSRRDTKNGKPMVKISKDPIIINR